MSSEELNWIKERQKEFREMFKKDLHVNWKHQMVQNDHPKITCSPEEHFERCCRLFGTTPEKVRNPDGLIKKLSPERRALLKFAIDSYRQDWPQDRIAEIVNKTRTTIYHYANNIYRQDKHLIGEA